MVLENDPYLFKNKGSAPWTAQVLQPYIRCTNRQLHTSQLPIPILLHKVRLFCHYILGTPSFPKSHKYVPSFLGLYDILLLDVHVITADSDWQPHPVYPVYSFAVTDCDSWSSVASNCYDYLLANRGDMSHECFRISKDNNMVKTLLATSKLMKVAIDSEKTNNNAY